MRLREHAMPMVMSTKVTRGGQTTVPKEIRDALGIEYDSRVYWSFDGSRVILSAEAPIPNEVRSEEEFWRGVELAMQDVATGKTRPAGEASARLRKELSLERA